MLEIMFILYETFAWIWYFIQRKLFGRFVEEQCVVEVAFFNNHDALMKFVEHLFVSLAQ